MAKLASWCSKWPWCAADEAGKRRANEVAARLRTNGKIARQVVLLAALYARTDQATLRKVRKMLQPWTFLADAVPSQLSAPAALLSVGGLALGAMLGTGLTNALSARGDAGDAAPPSRGAGVRSRKGVHLQTAYTAVMEKPAAWGAGVAGATLCGLGLYMRARHAKSVSRAVKLQAKVKVVKRRPVDDVASVLDLFVKGNDDVETIRCAAAQP